MKKDFLSSNKFPFIFWRKFSDPKNFILAACDRFNHNDTILPCIKGSHDTVYGLVQIRCDILV